MKRRRGKEAVEERKKDKVKEGEKREEEKKKDKLGLKDPTHNPFLSRTEVGRRKRGRGRG